MLSAGMTDGGQASSLAPYPLCDSTIAQIDFIPLRLTHAERKKQRLVRSAVSASEYTDRVDVLGNEKNRSMTIMKELYNLLLGLYFADAPLAEGVKMCRTKDADISETQDMVTTMFELSRRYKIMNPEIMRADYCKLLHIIQDSVDPEMQDQLGFHTLTPIVTVAMRAKELCMEELLAEPLLALATTPVPRLSSISELNRALRKKDATVKTLIKKYSMSRRVREDEVEVLIRSIDDANCYIRDNADTITTMINLLEKCFDPNTPDTTYPLAISEGAEGSRLSHGHSKQYHFVKQSLSLWRNITRHMYKLWLLMEEDFLDEDVTYTLTDTGQGANRKQQATRLFAAMEEVLNDTKREVDTWIGSDKVHLGDRQVPNGFVFIEKYSQISSIINPILCTLRAIPSIMKDADHATYIRTVWGSPEVVQKAILCDFFRHGFDGSGGDNDMDAGSCIDGRLTSAWHWCSEIKSKPFYPIFLLAGFGSFDGNFGE